MSKEIIDVEVVEDPLEFLSPKENHAYQYFLTRKDRKESMYAPIAPDAAAKLFGLYLNGLTLTEIWEQNQHFSLGQVVNSAVTDRWDLLKGDYNKRLLEQVSERAVLAQAEGVNFVVNMLTAAHKLHGEKAKKYLQTGKIEDLGPMAAMNVKSYKDLVELLQKLTGQENTTTSKVEGSVVHSHVMIPTEAPKEVAKGDIGKLLKNWAEDDG